MTTTPPSELFTVHEGDSRQLSRLLDPYSTQSEPLLSCTITSPPYGNLKNYGHPDQIGWGQPYEDYLIEMRRVFRNIFRHTRHDGSMWVVSDTLRPDESRVGGMPPRLDPLPFRLAAEAADSGWILREVIIWQKDKTLPWSSGGRLRNTFEYILLFVKGSGYKFRIDRLRDPVQLEPWWVKWPERYNPLGKVPSNIWDIPIPVQGSWKTPVVQHACPLPPDLVERLLYLTTDPGDVVFDPFAGTGVVIAEAERLGRRGIGIELNREYAKAYERSVRPEIFKRGTSDELTQRIERSEYLRPVIAKLRALKYAKVCVQQLTKLETMPRVRLVAVTMGRLKDKTFNDPAFPLEVELTFAVEEATADDVVAKITQTLEEIAERPPASKFGVRPTFRVCPPRQLEAVLKGRRFYLYTRGRTWDADGKTHVSDLVELAKQEWPKRGNDYTYPAIVSNVEVHEDPGRS